MKCVIRKFKYVDNANDFVEKVITGYFDKHLFDNQNHWVDKTDAKVFKTKKEAEATIQVYKLKNCEIEKV